MSIATAVSAHPVVLPDTPYAMWERDELRDFLHLPNDQIRIEVIAGEIFVSPSPTFGHDGIVRDILRTFWAAEDPGFPWACPTRADLNLVGTDEGYEPDVMVLQAEVLEALRDNDDRYAFPDQVEMVAEVTSRSNAGNDRVPSKSRPITKWIGYARAEIPYYLLVDRDPKAPLITLFSVPDHATRAYLHKDTWKFGDTISLEHFGLEIDTTGWKPWKV